MRVVCLCACLMCVVCACVRVFECFIAEVRFICPHKFPSSVCARQESVHVRQESVHVRQPLCHGEGRREGRSSGGREREERESASERDRERGERERGEVLGVGGGPEHGSHSHPRT